MGYKYRTGSKHTGAIIGAGCLIFILAIVFGYGVTLGLTGLVMWALCKLGVIASWTWGQAALWAVIAYIIWSILKSIFGGSKKSSD